MQVTVTDGSNPIAEAVVSVTVLDTVRTSTTNASGVATFGNMPSGTYTFTASHGGHASNTSVITVTDTGGSGTIALTSASGNVQITVYDENGGTLLNIATVTLELSPTQTMTATADNTEGSTGVARFSGVPVGTYSFRVSATGYVNGSGSVTVTPSGGSATIKLPIQKFTVSSISWGGTTVTPASVVVPYGGNATFTASNTDPLYYVQWYNDQNNSIVVGPTTYTVTNVQKDTIITGSFAKRPLITYTVYAAYASPVDIWSIDAYGRSSHDTCLHGYSIELKSPEGTPITVSASGVTNSFIPINGKTYTY